MKTKSFTLLELIVVIAIIGILVTLLIPSLNNAHKKSKNVVCLNNYKQNNLALSLYVKDNNGFFPIQNGSQTWWVGQSGNTGKYKK